MQQSQTIPGKLIAKLHLEYAKDLDTSVKDKLEEYIDLLLQHIHDGDLHSVSFLLRPQLFDLRVAVLMQLEVNTFIQRLDDRLSEKLLDPPHYPNEVSALDKATSRALINYHKIINPLLSGFTAKLHEPLAEYHGPLPTYQNLSAAVRADASGYLVLFKRWTDASLDLDFAMVVGELIAQGALAEADSSALVNLTYQSLEDFGYYAALLGIWYPEEEDEDQIVRNIKIRLSLTNTPRHGSGYTLEQIKSIVSG